MRSSTVIPNVYLRGPGPQKLSSKTYPRQDPVVTFTRLRDLELGSDEMAAGALDGTIIMADANDSLWKRHTAAQACSVSRSHRGYATENFRDVA
jgi:hypothetical protein